MTKTKLHIKLLWVSIALICMSTTIDKAEWGFYGHKRINRMAVFTLPSEMIGFYKRNIEYITEHAVDPDKRRYATKHEGVRHYIDIDHWGDNPFRDVPLYHSEAIMKYCDMYLYTTEGDTIQIFGNELNHSCLKVVDESQNLYKDVYGKEVILDNVEYSNFRDDYLVVKKNAQRIFGQDSMAIPMSELKSFAAKHVMKVYYDDIWEIPGEAVDALLADYAPSIQVEKAIVKDRFSDFGILPYNLVSYYNKLVKAFESKDEGRILRYSAEIGHYLGDAHVPLHTTENYNGQLTNQDGIHGFWESRLPELFADDSYDYWVGKAEYVDDPRTFFWDVVETSHNYVDSVLIIEKDLSKTFPQDKQFCFETRNTLTVRTQCEEYAAAFHDRLAGMVERRMTATVHAIGSIWFSAWVDAGQPRIRKMDKYALSEEERKKLEEEEKMFKSGDIKGRGHSN